MGENNTELTNLPIPWDGVRNAVKYLPRFEKPGFFFGRWNDVKVGGFPPVYWEPSKPVERFVRGLYDDGLIVTFDWPSWDYGKELGPNHEAISQLDALTCLKLLTMHVRADRFTEGHLSCVFEDGTIASILRRLRELLATAETE